MEEIFQHNAKIVYYFLYSMCRDEGLAEDLTQETFLKAIESIHRFDGSCKISTWLCQIAKHLLYQHWTKRKNYLFVELDETLISVSDTEQQAMNRVELSDVWDRVQSLPEKMKQVVELRILSDLAFKEIGQMLDKSENWARVTFYRAKLVLAKETQ
ncbi:MAG: sigma-70 family RNA polymerase sigma factor [Clostridiales bacterium]|nr:sigma-70 family RNA polymerase sigma factor [Clostridiales bacterium]